jgi:hypothetical protein
LIIEPASSKKHTPEMIKANSENTNQIITSVLQKRYIAEHKLLNLEALNEDAELKSAGIKVIGPTDKPTSFAMILRMIKKLFPEVS